MARISRVKLPLKSRLGVYVRCLFILNNKIPTGKSTHTSLPTATFRGILHQFPNIYSMFFLLYAQAGLVGSFSLHTADNNITKAKHKLIQKLIHNDLICYCTVSNRIHQN